MKKQHFYVITYDIADTRRRNKVVKLLEAVGDRVNLSVFECFLSKKQYADLITNLAHTIKPKTDVVNIYPLCADCYARATYLPQRQTIRPDTIVVV